jgi:hypothetical protein
MCLALLLVLIKYDEEGVLLKQEVSGQCFVVVDFVKKRKKMCKK